MLPCLHQRNINTKRKLRAWRDQKCIPLVGAITQLTCAGRENIPSRGRRFGPRMESCVNFDARIAMVPCLHQGNIYTKRKVRAWRDHKCIPLVGAITPLTCAGRQNTPSRGWRYRAQNGKLRKLGRTYHHRTVFALRKYLYQKEASGMERPEMYPLVGAMTPLTCTGQQIAKSRERRYRVQNGKLP